MNDMFSGKDYESLFRAHDATKLRVKELWQANEVANTRITELEAQLAAAQGKISRQHEILLLAEQVSDAKTKRLEADIAKWKQAYANEMERNLNIESIAADAAILDWMADNQAIEIIGDWDIHEIAIYVADERDAEPTVEDYRIALRRLIRAAMDEEHQYVKDLQGEEAAIREEVK